MKRYLALLLAGVALVVAVSGCAQGESPSAGPGEAMGTEASASVPGKPGGTLVIGMTAVNLPPLGAVFLRPTRPTQPEPDPEPEHEAEPEVPSGPA